MPYYRRVFVPVVFKVRPVFFLIFTIAVAAGDNLVVFTNASYIFKKD